MIKKTFRFRKTRKHPTYVILPLPHLFLFIYERLNKNKKKNY